MPLSITGRIYSQKAGVVAGDPNSADTGARFVNIVTDENKQEGGRSVISFFTLDNADVDGFAQGQAVTLTVS